MRGYEFPKATARVSGKAETRFEASSQDTGLVVLVAIALAIGFSVKEKDETSHPSVSGGFAFSRLFAGA